VKAGVALVAVLALLAAGCGGHSSSQQKAVTTYLDEVNRIDRSMVAEVASVNAAYRSLQAGRTLPRAARLHAAEIAILSLRDRVAAIDAPPAAAKIRGDLLRLFGDDALVAHQLTQMAAFLPRFERTSAPFVAAHKELSNGLRTAKKPAGEAAILERYAARSRAELAALAGLDPPAVLAPLYQSRVSHLKKSVALSTRLAQALRRGDRAAAQGLSLRLEALEGGVEELNGANAEAAAVAAYSRRLDEISRLEARIDTELLKLQGG